MTKFIAILFCLCACVSVWAASITLPGEGLNIYGAGIDICGRVLVPPTHTNYCSGRFTVWNTNQNVVVDNASGLTWARNASGSGEVDWWGATNYCNGNFAGYSDWRLPSLTEFSRNGSVGSTNGLIDAYPSDNDPALPTGHPFTNIISGYYWTSKVSTGDTNSAWFLESNGELNTGWKSNPFYAWPVRGP